MIKDFVAQVKKDGIARNNRYHQKKMQESIIKKLKLSEEV
jgi:hypothetical protein